MSIEFEHVSYTYSPKSPLSVAALKDVSFTIKEGTVTALVGRTGSGKSTVTQLMNALLTPTMGTVKVNDIVNSPKIRKKRKEIKRLRKEVGLVFQFPEYQLFCDTVEKDVAFGPRNFGLSQEKALEKARASLRLVGLDESFDKRSPFELSGGEKRKAAIAGILAIEPKYLLLDEPTSGLDPEAAAEMMGLFKKINERGTTIVFVTHDMDLVLEYADDVIVMDDGEVAFQGPPLALFDQDLSKHALANPHVFEMAKSLKQKGFALDFSNLKNIEDLASSIAKAYGGSAK